MKDWIALRWIYHARACVSARDSRLDARGAYVPASLASEGFVHGSFAPKVLESARLYLSRDAPIEVLCIDPRRVRSVITYARTPRGVMPHVHGPIEPCAQRGLWSLERFDPSRVGDVLRARRLDGWARCAARALRMARREAVLTARG